MNSVTQFLYNILAGINGVVGNYGVSIIIFTFLMRMICMPFDYKSRKGMRKMSAIQPKLNELQKKYGNDKQKFQQKQAELMRKEGYNPLSGCLPMLLTWPLMIAMFAAMRAIANEQLAMQAFRYLAGEDNVVSAADRFLWVKNIWMTDSLFTPIAPNASALQVITQDVWQRAYDLLNDAQRSAIIQNLAGQALDFSSSAAVKASVEAMTNALQSIPTYAAAVEPVSGWSGLNFFLFTVTLYKQYNGLLIFPILAGVTQILQTKYNPQMTEQATAQPSNGQGAGMNNFMKYFFPLLSVFFCLTSNAGFAVYWVTSTCVMWLQSIVITKYLAKKDEQKAKSVTGEGSVK
ncbi:MAG: YidC/Oxa1 family membrane protein insertase [Clostridia bacterium]|nr:YidC/Oxa1 family membrane protein insertase [Clostridia bacterium]